MPKNHQLYQWNAGRFLNWAKTVGPNTYTVIDKHIHRYSVEEQSYKPLLLQNYTLCDEHRVLILYFKNLNASGQTPQLTDGQ
jgi:hypothetical protein